MSIVLTILLQTAGQFSASEFFHRDLVIFHHFVKTILISHTSSIFLGILSYDELILMDCESQLVKQQFTVQ